MANKLATSALAIGCFMAAAPAWSDPYICVGAMTDVDVLFRVKQSAYFRQQPQGGRPLRLEYNGCGYRIFVGESSPHRRDGDMLLVDAYGHVTKVVRKR